MSKNSKIIVQKFGGSSVGSIERIKKVARRIVTTREKGFKVTVVVSALGDTTDDLICMAHKINPHPQEREMDMLMSTGEQVSVALLAMAIHHLGYKAISFTGAQVGILTDKIHTKARIIDINAERIREELAKDKIVIVAGFQGINLDQDITTLGRGGSDMTAVALAKVLKADMCEIYTDVDGVYTADPRVVKDARKLDEISYEEMLEMASLGAQVMQARSIEACSKFDIPLHVRNSFNNKKGTMIIKEASDMEDVLVRAVAANKNEAKLTICDVPDKPGAAAKIFKGLAKHSINIDMIVQNVSRTGSTDVSFTVEKTDLDKAIRITEAISKEIKSGNIICDKEIAKISVVGIGMRGHSGVAADMFEALARANVNIDMISTSEIKISCLISKKDADKAVLALHKKFNLHKK